MLNFTKYRKNANITNENPDQTDALYAIVTLNNDEIESND